MSGPRLRRIFTTVAVLTATVILPAAPALAQSTGSGSSGSSSGSGPLAAPIPSPAGLAALAAATTQTGKPYLWGGTGPNAWDCSGLVQWAFRQAGVNLPRTTWEQAEVGLEVPLWALMPGDVIILNRDASHVGIYTGFGQVFNAYGRGVPVGLTPLSEFEIYSIRRF
ncbi:C40 family peptidase [Aldersonia sp. NBC_00410]|uniref:C40 family peptidase n=1 Tax=Aldersonia sp. NBC_00410 TaxID=2975954 RepID=UPI002250144B|nr:NlpC/P60 family protein [Aldersonia sp. NBC_00410]MCX5041965.1 C40 family peptidase [Aldersonia sp. NBC_00410]